MTWVIASVLWPLVGITSFCFFVFGVVLVCFCIHDCRNCNKKGDPREQKALCPPAGTPEVVTFPYFLSASMGFEETDQFIGLSNSRSTLHLEGTPLSSALLPRARYSPSYRKLIKMNGDNLSFPSKFSCENEPWAFANFGYEDDDVNLRLKVRDLDLGCGNVIASTVAKEALDKDVKRPVGGKASEKIPECNNPKTAEKRITVRGKPWERLSFKSIFPSSSHVSRGASGNSSSSHVSRGASGNSSHVSHGASGNSSSVMTSLDHYESDFADRLQDITDDESVKFKSEIILGFKDVEHEGPQKLVRSGWFVKVREEENAAPCSTFKGSLASGQKR